MAQHTMELARTSQCRGGRTGGGVIAGFDWSELLRLRGEPRVVDFAIGATVPLQGQVISGLARPGDLANPL